MGELRTLHRLLPLRGEAEKGLMGVCQI